MRIIADLHIHSRYSRATSREMTLDTVALWAALKGVNLVTTGDFTHPAHFASIEKKLVPASNGLFTLEGKKTPHFMLTTEVSNIYTQDGKTRKIHNLIFAPTVEAARKINSVLARLGNISSDGRPIFGFPARELVKIALDADPRSMIVPAHAWTPWFSMFGSKSGFSSIEECFGEYSKHIYAIETGLSSTPAMNRRLSALDGIALISNSDAHSPRKLAREATVLECAMDYDEITAAIRSNDRKRFLFTIEFYPEEGKYHYDGHRNCGVLFSPEETKRVKGMCPRCGEAVTVGVASRVDELSDRPPGVYPEWAPLQAPLVPLEEILAEVLNRGVNAASLRKEYRRLVEAAGSELALLMDMDLEELERISTQRLACAVRRVRRGEINIRPGFDGEYGKIKIFADAQPPPGPAQMGLFKQGRQ